MEGPEGTSPTGQGAVAPRARFQVNGKHKSAMKLRLPLDIEARAAVLGTKRAVIDTSLNKEYLDSIRHDSNSSSPFVVTENPFIVKEVWEL
jgi:hypothetical protein